MRHFFRSFALALAFAPVLCAQQSSSSSASGDEAPPQERTPTSAAVPRRGVEQGGSAVSLETSETVFQIAAALNTCGYDNGLESSLPVRSAVRADMAAAVEASVDTRESQIALCKYIHDHTLSGSLNLAQFVSLALFTTAPPETTLAVAEGDLPPDSIQVVGVLPLLRDFAAKARLHQIFLRHRLEYEAAADQVHDSVTKMLLETNSYLHQPVSSYDGRRFLVLIEPMLSPQAVNARVYGSDYFVVASPARIDGQPPERASYGSRMTVSSHAGGLQMDQVRHTYLLYNVDPIIYARAASTNRLLPILKVVQDAPIDAFYKNDIVAFTTQCLILAVEARNLDVGFPRPRKPVNVKARAEIDTYNLALIDYEKKAEAARRHQVLLDVESGWVLTGSFYEKLALEDREGISLKESIAEMVYGMDVPHEESVAKKIPFFALDSPNLVSGGGLRRGRAPKRTLTTMDQAELKLQKNDRNGAAELAEKELAGNPASGEAQYILARVKLLEGDPEDAMERFQKVIGTSKDARTLGWSHIYVGRLIDAQQQGDRTRAVNEYKAALAIPGVQADVRAAAEAGIQKRFAAPRRTVSNSDQRPESEEELDPTGKKQKQDYRPSEEVAPGTRPATR